MTDQVIENNDFSQLTDGTQDEQGQPRRRRIRNLFTLAAAKKASGFAVDFGARFGVTNLAKAGVAGLAVGFGASVLVTSAAAIAAAGVVTGAYTYTLDTFRDYRAARAADEEFHFLSLSRAKKAGISLLCGVAGGAVGTALAQSDIAQSFFRWAIETAGPAVHSAVSGACIAMGICTPSAKDVVDVLKPEISAAPAPAPAEAAAKTVADAAAAKTSAAASAAADNAADVAGSSVEVEVTSNAPADINVQINGVDANIDGADANHGGGSAIDDIIANNGAAAPVESSDVIARAADALSASGDADLAAALTDGTASPQDLKDAAHEVLRSDSLSAGERVELARALAEKAQALGNGQASTFLADLARLYGDAAPAASDNAGAAFAHVDAGSDFEVAARCTATFDAGTDNVSDVSCEIRKTEMAGGSGVVFNDSAHPERVIETVLGEGSDAVSTEDFVSEEVISDGVSRLAALRPR